MKQEEAMKILKDFHDKSALFSVRTALDTIIPELKESEDERTRKEIIGFLQLPHPQFVGERKQEKWVAWLEKQGENPICKVKIGEKYKCIASPRYTCFSIGDIYEVTDDFIAKLINLCSDCFILLEKQDEPQVYEIEDGKVITYSETGGYKAIEPKFKAGDWIVTDKNHTWLIDEDCSTTGYSYRLISQNGKVEVGDYNIVDEHAHLWTIQDAKPGDVLVCNDNPFLFSKCEKDEYGLVCCSYCGIPGNGEFTVNTNTKKYWCDCEFVCPATKEQRDLLFREMMKSGYEWSENKGLKYIY